jgi:hypothetical protein
VRISPQNDVFSLSSLFNVLIKLTRSFSTNACAHFFTTHSLFLRFCNNNYGCRGLRRADWIFPLTCQPAMPRSGANLLPFGYKPASCLGPSTAWVGSRATTHALSLALSLQVGNARQPSSAASLCLDSPIPVPAKRPNADPELTAPASAACF